MSLQAAIRAGEGNDGVAGPLDSDLLDTSGTPRRRPRFPFATATLVASIGIWQLVVTAFHVPAYLLPAPSAIATFLAHNWSFYLHESVPTIEEIVFGFALSVAIGVPLAVVIVYSSMFERAAYPLIVTSQTIPKVAIAPLVLVWFGFGVWPKVGIVVLIAFFPIIINTVVGFKSVPREMIDLVRALGARRLETFRKIMIPHALPNIFSGMKIASTLAVIGAVVAELVGANQGLGYVITVAGSTINMAEQFGAVAILSVIGIVFFYLVGLIERFAVPWHASVRQGDIATQF